MKVQGNFKVYTKSRFHYFIIVGACAAFPFSFRPHGWGRTLAKKKEDFTRQYGNLTENIYTMLT